MNEEKIDISESIKRFSNVMMRFLRHNVPSHKKNQMTHQQSVILTYIYNNQLIGRKIYQKDIEAQFSIRRSTATECMKRLENGGFITRQSSPIDSRLKDIILTKKTLTILKDVKNKKEELANIIGEGITNEELLVIKNIIIKMEKNLEKREAMYEKNTKKHKK